MAIATASSFSRSGPYTFEWDASYDSATRVLTLNVVGLKDGVPAAAGTCSLTIRLANGQVRTFDLTPFQNLGQQLFSNINARTVLTRGGLSGFEIVEENWTPPQQ